VAFDARFELLSTAQLERVARLEARAGDWRQTLNGYNVFVLSRTSDRALARSLVHQFAAKVVFSWQQVVVLRRRG
jgi:hypothetical protein